MATTAAAGVDSSIKRQIKLPVSKAVGIAAQSVRIRLGRSVITIGGIFLAIAFLMSNFVTGAMTRTLMQEGSTEVQILLQASAGEDQAKTIWLVSLSLLVCVIGITNAMLTSVSERYREIGTMKCLGALDGFIIELFLLESSFQGLVGAVGGTILGLAGPLLIGAMKYGKEAFGALSPLLMLKYGGTCIAIGVILSVIGAIYPAYRAMKMVPADAMRRE